MTKTKATEVSMKLRQTAKRVLWATIVIFLVVVVVDVITNPPKATDSPKVYEAIYENYYVTFKINDRELQGEAIIVAKDNESYIIQMGNNVYVVLQGDVVFE